MGLGSSKRMFGICLFFFGYEYHRGTRCGGLLVCLACLAPAAKAEYVTCEQSMASDPADVLLYPYYTYGGKFYIYGYCSLDDEENDWLYVAWTNYTTGELLAVVPVESMFWGDWYADTHPFNLDNYYGNGLENGDVVQMDVFNGLATVGFTGFFNYEENGEADGPILTTDLNLDNGMDLGNDGAGNSNALTQDGSGNLWLVVGNDEDGYTYQPLGSTGLDPEDAVETTQYDGDWESNEDGSYTFFSAVSSANLPSGPPPSIRPAPDLPPLGVTVDITVLPSGKILIAIRNPGTGKIGAILLNPDGSYIGGGTVQPKP
jgi:hypothetical protein